MRQPRQVVVIHGGNAFPTYEEYLSYLRGKKVEGLGSFNERRDWRATLPDCLGSTYDVVLPRMPSKDNAKYQEWKIWFEKILPFLDTGVILIGHSLGGTFLAKFLSEQMFPKKIVATLLVSAPYDMDRGRLIAEFTLPASLELLTLQGGSIGLYHSKDDPVVPFAELAKYKKALPSARARVLNDRGHINQQFFPDIVTDIRCF